MTSTPKAADLPFPLPRHLAIIMDGNGRWAKARDKPRIKGHQEGSRSVRALVETCRRIGVPFLTLYVFSEENWGRPQAEVAALMKLLGRFLKKEKEEMLDKGVRLNAIGDLAKLPRTILSLLRETMDQTRKGKHLTLTLALSYGGRQEICVAARALAREAAAGRLDPDSLDEADLSSRLYTHDLPEPDLLIRTSGELRVSNFLLWQLAYTEFYFTETHFPDFREAELMQALFSYAARQRRFGKTGEQKSV